MKAIKSLVAIAVALAAMIGFAGDSAPFRLDTMEGTRVARDVETISYSTEWDNGTTVRVAVDGLTLKEASAPASGDVAWNAANADRGYHTLKHTTYKNGVVRKVETVTFQVCPIVTFVANGGSLGTESAIRPVAEGAAIGALPMPTRTGYTFAGWWTSASGGTQISPSTTVNGHVTYYAHWTMNQYTVAFSASDIDGMMMKYLNPSGYAHMTTVIFEEGVTEIPKNFFDECNDVTSVTWPSTLREFGADAVPSKIRASLTYDENGFMIYNNWILDYQDRNAAEVVIPEGIVGIGRGAFAAMFDLETVTMPESLKCIATGAFEDCSWIQNLQFMSGLRYVGPSAFNACSSLLRATFADGVEYIGGSAFEDCWQMQSVRLPFTVSYIGANAFSGCSAIRGVTVPTHVKTMQQLFPASYSKIETAEVAEGETVVMDDMFAGCTALRGGATQTDMSMIPNTVTNIGARAFQNCSSLTAFVLPDSVIEIGESVFRGCTALWNVTLSRSLTAIPDYAFYGCSMLETMIVPESVTYLGNRFFSGRTNPTPGIVIENALYYLCTNAPNYHVDAYSAISGNMTTYVLQNSRSWDGRQGSRVLPQLWNGYDITYWTPNRFDVTFDANGGQFDAMGGSTWSEQQITDMNYVVPSTEPVRPGWAFEGWWTEQTGGAEVRYTTLVTATRTHAIYAHWRSLGNKMTVTFNSNGGTVVTPGSQDYVPGQTFGQFPVPTRRGYTFQGWWTEAVNGIRMTEATQVPAADMELFAHWTPITYYVRFHANGGTGTMSDQPFTYDVSGALKTHAFTRTGFAFTGWATTPSGQVRYAANKTVVNLEEVDGEIVDLYAVWSGVGYSVRFDSNGGTGIMDNQTIAVGETQNLWLCAFARGGYTFAGWALSPTDAEAKKVAYLDGAAVRDLATVNGAVVPLYAVWVSEGQMVRISFDANGGSVSPDYWNCNVGTAVESFPTPTRPGFTFAGWWTAKTGGTLVPSIVSVTSAQTFYAHWTPNGSVVPGDGSCTVTFNPNGGSVSPTTRKVDSGVEVGELPTPARTGYTFSGWYTAASGGVRVTNRTVVRSSVTYYAHWIATWTVTLDANGGMLEDADSGVLESAMKVQIEKGKAVGALPVPTRLGYSFSGWWTAKTKGTKISASTKVTKNVTYYARWTVRKYKVTAAVSAKAVGKVSGAGTKTFNGKVTLKATPAKGYVFVKWENLDDPETPWPSALKYRQPSVSFKMGAANLSVRAVFAKKTADSALSLMVDPSVMWYVEDDPDREIAVVADSLSYPAVTLSGASAGIGLVRVAGTDNAYVLKVTDSSKMNPGVYTAKVTAKNRAGKSVAKSVKIVTPNSSAAIDAGLIAGLETSTLSPYVASGGMKTKWTLADLGVDVFATNGWKLVSVTGLPTGLSWNGTAIVGTASKVGVYTVTFKMQKTVKVGKKTTTYTSTASATFKVEALLPGELAGTYNGFANTSIETVGGDEENPLYAPFVDGMASAVKVSVTTAGKITANVGGVALSGTGFDDVTNGVYSVMLKKTQKITKGSLKGKSKVWELRLEIAPDASWDSVQLTGTYTAYTTGMPSMAAPTLVVAQRNAFSSDAAAKEVAAAVVVSGNKGVKGFVVNKAYGEDYAYTLDCAECVIGGKAVVTATAKANGTVVLAGTIAKTKVSGTAVLDVSPAAEDVYEEIRTATARFFTSKFVIEVVYTLEDGEVVGTSGRVWKK